MMFYVLTIVRLAQMPAWQRIFAPMAAAGRMPLTNYLMQTLIATTIFYGWGFGLWGTVGPAAGLALAFAIFFVIQVPLSLWWLKRFEMGPMEWVWRVSHLRSPPGDDPLCASGPRLAANPTAAKRRGPRSRPSCIGSAHGDAVEKAVTPS